jgi:hypothetical protein
MQAIVGARPRRTAAHLPKEESTPEGKTRISCAAPGLRSLGSVAV